MESRPQNMGEASRIFNFKKKKKKVVCGRSSPCKVCPNILSMNFGSSVLAPSSSRRERRNYV
jgi:hypothetical protein